MRWLMDLRGEKDVIGWSSLPAVERDAAQHLQHRATERKRRRPSARESLFHHRRLSTAENFSCRGEIMTTARSTSRLFIAGKHLPARQNIGIHPSIPLQHVPSQGIHTAFTPIWFFKASEILKNDIFVPIRTKQRTVTCTWGSYSPIKLVFSPCTGFRCCKQNRHVTKHNRDMRGGIARYFAHKAEKCRPWKCNLDNLHPEARNDAGTCEMKRRQGLLM